jgi:hypothetical protein
LQAVEIYTPGTPATLVTTVWNNLTQGTVLGSAPLIANITPISSSSSSLINTTIYAVNTAGSGYAVGDSLEQVQVLSPSNGAVQVTVWNNLTQGTVLGAAPVLTSITPQTSQLPFALGPQSAAESLSVYVQNPATGSSTAVNSYTVSTLFVDGTTTINVGDILQNILVFNSSGSLTSNIWFDVNIVYTLLSPPPTGDITLVVGSGATAINQSTQITAANLTNTNLSTISSQIPTTLGQKLKAASMSVAIASDDTVATSSAQLPTTLGVQTPANSLSVVVANANMGDVASTALFQANTAFSGASVGDIIQSIAMYTAGSSPAYVATVWNNLTTGLALGSAPTAANLTPLGNIVTPTLPQTTPNLSSSTTTGTVPAGAIQISFANTGAGPATIGSNGVTIPPGATLDFQAASGGTLGAISYVATGTTLLIATVA